MESKQTNQYLTVQALTQYIKRKFDGDPYMQKVYVVGEVSNFRLRPNNHQYFSLKDEKARIGAVMFRSAFNKLPFQLEEGMKVLAVGRISVYEPNGNYQITIERMEPDGIGALYQALEQLKEKLRREGVFDLPKKPIPRFPKKIAVITSPTGSVIRDIITTIQRRCPIVEITVFPTRVQGKEATGEIVQAFEKVNDLAEEFDTIILARGGGSIEDLWCFNEEAVARAILKAKLPVISSIGHETDTTIADLVADLRAPTPTAAAEQAVPVLADLLNYIQQLQGRLHTGMNQRLQLLRKQLERASQSYTLLQPERLYQPYAQSLDLLYERLIRAGRQDLDQRQERLGRLNQALMHHPPSHQIRLNEQKERELRGRLQRASQQYLQEKQNAFKQQVELLDAMSPLNSLARGYTIVEQEGQVIKGIEELQADDVIDVRFIDGRVQAKVQTIEAEDLRDT